MRGLACERGRGPAEVPDEAGRRSRSIRALEVGVRFRTHVHANITPLSRRKDIGRISNLLCLQTSCQNL